MEHRGGVFGDSTPGGERNTVGARAGVVGLEDSVKKVRGRGGDRHDGGRDVFMKVIVIGLWLDLVVCMGAGLPYSRPEGDSYVRHFIGISTEGRVHVSA